MAIVRIFIGLSILLFVVSTKLLAASDEDLNAEALSKTQDLLRSSEGRKKAAAESPKAAATMKSAESLVGPNHTQELYDLSAEVMGTMTKRSGGNADKMSADVNKSPEDFIKLLTPEQWAKIQELARKVEAERAPSSNLQTTPPK